MRSLRSGKPLPDTPPVKRRGSQSSPERDLSPPPPTASSSQSQRSPSSSSQERNVNRAVSTNNGWNMWEAIAASVKGEEGIHNYLKAKYASANNSPDADEGGSSSSNGNGTEGRQQPFVKIELIDASVARRRTSVSTRRSSVEEVDQVESPVVSSTSRRNSTNTHPPKVSESEPAFPVAKRGRGRPPKRPRPITYSSAEPPMDAAAIADTESSSTDFKTEKVNIEEEDGSCVDLQETDMATVEVSQIKVARRTRKSETMQIDKEEVIISLKSEDTGTGGHLQDLDEDAAKQNDTGAVPNQTNETKDGIEIKNGVSTEGQEEKTEESNSDSRTELRRSLRCPKKKPVYGEKIIHSIEPTPTPPRVETCSVCGETFKNRTLLFQHKKVHKPPDSSPSSSSSSSKQNSTTPTTATTKTSRSKSKFKPIHPALPTTQQLILPAEEKKVEPLRIIYNRAPISDFTRKRPSIPSLALSKPVACHMCGMTFTRRAHLNRHMLLHSGVKPFECDICNIRFTRKDHMLAHKIKHSESNRIQCKQCGLGFASWKILQEHAANVHHRYVNVGGMSGIRPRPMVPQGGGMRMMSYGGMSSRPATSMHRGFVSQKIRPQQQQQQQHLQSTFRPSTGGSGGLACELCGKKFLQRRYLRAHRKLHVRKEAAILNQLRMADQAGAEFYMEDDEGEGDDDKEGEVNGKMPVENGHKFGGSTGPGQEKERPTAVAAASSSSTTHTANKGEETASRRQTRSSSASAVPRVSVNTNDSEFHAVNKVDVMNDDEEDDDNDEDLEQYIECDDKAMLQLNSAQQKFQEEMGNGNEEEEIEIPDGEIQAVDSSNSEETFESKDEKIDDAEEGVEGEMDDEQETQSRECSICGEQFTEKNELRKHYKIHKRRYICRFCGARLASAGSLMRHNLTHTGRKAFACELCGRKFTRKDTLAVHKKAHEKMTTRFDLPKPFSCKICGTRYTLKYNVARHIKVAHKELHTAIMKKKQHHHADLKAQEINEEMTETEQRVKVKQEPQTVEPWNMVDTELQDRDEGEEEGIEEISPTDEELQQCAADELNPDEAEEGFSCDHCDKKFKTPKSLNTHKWYHSHEKLFVCDICSRAFKYSTDLARHINTHNNDSQEDNLDEAKESSKLTKYRAMRGRPNSGIDTRPFGCKICPQRFNHRSNLSRHMRLIHNANARRDSSQDHLIKSRIAQMTAAATQNKRNKIMLAQAQQQQQRQRALEQPSTSSGSRVGLANQLVAMQNPAPPLLTPDNFTYDAQSTRPYICNLCGKDFENKNNIWTHMRIHYKSFECEFCGLKMATRGDMILHLRTHTGEKPHECPYCDWRFIRKSGLNKHITKYHGQQIRRQHIHKLSAGKVGRYGSMQQTSYASQGRPSHHFARQTQNAMQLKMNNSSGMEISTINSLGSVSERLMSRKPVRLEGGGMRMMHHRQERLGGLVSGGMSVTRTGSAFQSNRYTCRLCKVVVFGKLSYLQHMSKHTGSTKLPGHGPSFNYTATGGPRCPLCGKGCSSLGFLKRHYQYVHPDVPYPGDAPLFGRSGIRMNTSGRKESSAMGGLAGDFLEFPAQTDENDHTIDGDMSEIKPRVVRTVKIGPDGEEISDEEFPDESDEPPNTIKPDTPAGAAALARQELLFQKSQEAEQSGRLFLDDEDMEVDDDELNYGTMIIPKAGNLHSQGRQFQHHHHRQQLQLQDQQFFLPPCEKCGKCFESKKARADHIWYCKRAKVYCCPIIQCNKLFKLKHDFTRHIRRHTNERRFPCYICSKRFLHKLDMHGHMRQVHKYYIKRRPFPCDFCESHYNSTSELNSHMQVTHGILYSDVFFDNNTVGYDDMEGEVGQEEFEEYMMNMNSMGQGGMEEEEMGVEGEEAILGIGNGEEEDDDFADDDEEYGMDPSSFLELSMEGGNSTAAASTSADAIGGRGEESYHCAICNKFFPTRQKWLYHRYYHIREEKHDCPHANCGEKFKLRSHLERHIRTYHNEDKPLANILNCPMCPRKFTREYDLSTHVNKIHQESTSTPKVMPTLQKKKPKLVPAPSTATSSSEVTAPVPHKPLPQLTSSRPQLKPQGSTVTATIMPKLHCIPIAKRGEATEAGEDNDPSAEAAKPRLCDSVNDIEFKNGVYHCKLCGKKCYDRKSIDAHRYYHNRLEKHHCQNCGAKFKQKSDLARHTRIHHSKSNSRTTLHCPKCYRCFTDTRYLRMHIKRYHPGEEVPDSEDDVTGMNHDGFGSPMINSIASNVNVDYEGDGEQLSPEDSIMNESSSSPTIEDGQEGSRIDMEENGEMQFDQGMQEEEYSNGGNEGIKGLTITCEGCGLELDAHCIAEHFCSASETLDFEETETKVVTAVEKDSPSSTNPNSNSRTTSKDSDEVASDENETGVAHGEDGDNTGDSGETDEFQDSNEYDEKMKEMEVEPFKAKVDVQSNEDKDTESSSQKLVTSAPAEHDKGGDHQQQLSLIEECNDVGESSHVKSSAMP